MVAKLWFVTNRVTKVEICSSVVFVVHCAVDDGGKTSVGDKKRNIKKLKF